MAITYKGRRRPAPLAGGPFQESKYAPPLWNFNPMLVDPRWRWVWESNLFAALAPFWSPNYDWLDHGPYGAANPFSAQGANATWLYDERFGWGLEGNGNTNCGHTTGDTGDYDWTGDITYVWFGEIDADATGRNLMTTFENASPYEGDLLGLAGTTNQLRLFRGIGTNSATSWNTGTGMFTNGVPVVITMRHRVSDGFAHALTSENEDTATYSRTPVAGGHGLTICNNPANGGANRLDGRCWAAYRFGEFLSDAQCHQFIADPFGPFRRAGTLFIDVADGGVGPYYYNYLMRRRRMAG